MFIYEKWKVYRLAVEMREIADELSRTAREGLGKDMDQLRRTAASVTSNTGEGAMRRPKAVKINFYDIARGAAGEYNGILKGIWSLHPNRRLLERGCEAANHFSILMLKLIKSVELRDE